MGKILKAACVQMNSGPNIQENLDNAADLIRDAAGQGAKLIATPENTCHIRHPFDAKLKSAPEENVHPALPQFSELAKELGVWVLIGSISVPTGDGKLHNRSYLISDSGEIKARYNKIHLFDVTLSEDESYRESAIFAPGDALAVPETPWGGLGMSICYDLRFAYMYRQMAQRGAKILSIPAAFTVPTGKAHWNVLMRARAIETGSFVIAPGQTGTHEGGRETYGHSIIVGPWGDVLAEAEKEVGVVTADLDMEDVAKARQSIPALQHDRPV